MLNAMTDEPDVAQVVRRYMLGEKVKNDIAQSIRVEIYNQTYNIRSDGDSNILCVCEYVDGKMREISSVRLQSTVWSRDFSPHIADEYHQLKASAGNKQMLNSLRAVVNNAEMSTEF